MKKYNWSYDFSMMPDNKKDIWILFDDGTISSYYADWGRSNAVAWSK